MVFYSASKMVLLTEFFIKNRFFTLFLPRSFESCTYTHSSLGSFIPGIFENVQQVPVRIAIVIRVVSSLPGVSSTPRSFVCLFVLSDVLTPYAYAPPWTPLNPGFYSIIFPGLPKHLLVLYDKSAMESSAVSSLPDHAFTPTPRKHGVERSTMKHSSEICRNRPSCESHC